MLVDENDAGQRFIGGSHISFHSDEIDDDDEERDS
jgi:hypothetical protein